MDTDPDFVSSKQAVLDSGLSSATTVCLPFSLVPGMDTSSKAYQKALTTLGKQNSLFVPKSKPGPLRRLMDQGTLDHLFLHDHFLILNLRYPIM